MVNNLSEHMDAYKEALTIDDIEIILQFYNIEDYQILDSTIILPTYCHNPIGCGCSHKLHYYNNSKNFVCYTECSSSFNIYEFTQKIYNITFNEYINLYEAYYTIVSILAGRNITVNVQSGEQFGLDKFNKHKPFEYIELPSVGEHILDVFYRIPNFSWVREGIHQRTQILYQIGHYSHKNRISIPHRDMNGRLIGIRGRALNSDELERGQKYMPIKIEDTLLSHPLSLNLYGLHLTKDNIMRDKKIIVFESEKAVMMYDSYFGTENNISVAICGSSVSKYQSDLIIKKLHPSEVIIALDRQYESSNSDQAKKYYNKMIELCRRFTSYCTASFIFDDGKLLNYKDAPIDQGPEIFARLLNKRKFVNTLFYNLEV